MAMKSLQGWGWLVAGVLALGLNGIYHDGGADWARRAVSPVVDRIVDRTEPVLALAAGRADWFATKTNLLLARKETASCRFATVVARFQTSLLRTNLLRTKMA